MAKMKWVYLILMLVAASVVVTGAKAVNPCQDQVNELRNARIWLNETLEAAEPGGAGNININPDVIAARQRVADAADALAECGEENAPAPVDPPKPNICDDGEYGPWPPGDPHNDCPGFR